MKIPKLNYEEGDSLEEIFKQNKDIVYNRIFESIKFGVKKNLKEVFVFELGSTESYLNLSINDWKTSLENCIEYFTEMEDYEKCMECKKIIKKINPNDTAAE
jgi:hypothetical protein